MLATSCLLTLHALTEQDGHLVVVISAHQTSLRPILTLF